MKFSTISSILALAGSSVAAPAKRDDATNLLVLQFALTLEHLENYFYSHALRRLRTSDFEAIGFNKSYYTNLRYIASDEKSHVQLLTSAIAETGAKPVKECKYNFADNMTASEFITLSSVLEGVGTSAYLGGAPLISSSTYLTVAGSILVTEALHTSLQRNAAKLVPFATPYGTPVDPMSIYTLAANFIVSCPKDASSFDLGFTAYPALNYQGAAPVPMSSTVSFTTANAAPAGSYLTFVYGLSATSVAATISGNTASAAAPADAAGQVYTFLTSAPAANGALAPNSVLAGPAIVEIIPAEPCFLSVKGCGVA